MIVTYNMFVDESALNNRPFEEGALYFITNSGCIYVDPIGGSKRIKISDTPVILATESARTSLSYPINNKLYIVVGSKSFYLYYNNSWNKLSGDFPACTTSDNNKVLTVVSGKPSWKELDLDHTHTASDVTGGTFGGTVYANSSYQTPGTSLLRNSKLVSTESTPTVNGEIILVYE